MIQLKKEFSFKSPLSPDKVLDRIKEVTAVSYPYYADRNKLYKGRIDGYSFEMQKIDEMMKYGFSSKKNTPIKIMGTVAPDGSGSIIKIATGKNYGVIIAIIFASLCLIVFLVLLVVSSIRLAVQVVPMMFLFPCLIVAMSFRRLTVDFDNVKTFLHAILNGN
jgi:hypothetical protein